MSPPSCECLDHIFGTITNQGVKGGVYTNEPAGGREGGSRSEKRGMSGRFGTAADARLRE